MNAGPNGVSAVLLAAGAGSRFGGGKLLAPFAGRTLPETVLGNLEAASVDEVVAVVGADGGGGELRGIFERYGARVVENTRWREGQSTSVLAGLRALGPGARAAVVLLGDQPLVGAGAVGRLVAAFEGGAGIAVATYGGRPRNPVLFSRGVWPLLEEGLSGDEGGRAVLRRHPGLAVGVACDRVAGPSDVDTPEDLRLLEQRRGFWGDNKMVREQEVP